MRSVLTARISVQCVPHRTRVAMRSASLRSRLDLGSIFGAKHQSSRTPPVERHGTPRNRPTRTGRQQGRAPNQDKRRLGARQQRQPSRGRRTRGPRSIGLFLLMKGCAGWGGGGADAGLPMGLGIRAGSGSGVDMRVPLIDVSVSVRALGR